MKKLIEGVDFSFRSSSRQDSLGRKANERLEDGTETFLRALWPGKENWFAELRNSNSFRDLVLRGLLEDEVPDPEAVIDGYGLILRQKKLPFWLKAWKVPLDRRFAMAASWLEINLRLADDGLGLRDAHTSNWGFSHCQQPVWVDVGSVVNLETGLEGLEEFRAWHTRPLSLALKRPSWILDYLSKPISRVQSISLTFPRLVKPSSPFSRFLRHDDIVMKIMRRFVPTLFQKLAMPYRRLILTFWMHRIRRWSRREVTTGLWSDYRRPSKTSNVSSPVVDSSQPHEEEGRKRTILRLISQSEAEVILDIGANDGWLIFESLQEGKTFWAVDPDHGAISKFTRNLAARVTSRSIKVCGAVDSFAETDARADLVVALALTHHLFLSQGLEFRQIAARLGELASKEVIVEFMPWGLAVSGQLEADNASLPEGYSLDNFVEAVREYFPVIDTYSPRMENPPRIIVHGRKV